MIELFFPVAGALFVFFVAIPALTLVARALLAWAPAARAPVAQHGAAWRYALIVGPALGPVVWLISATIHQSEAGAPLATCAVDHLGSALCRDVVLFGLVLLLILAAGVVRRTRGPGAPGRASEDRLALASERARVAALCARHPALRRLARRVHVVASGAAPVCTRGLLRPRIEIDTQMLAELADDELEAVLLHEHEHAHAGDPLRLFVAQVALSINPLGHLLAPALSRYGFAREALCDRGAVQRGAEPLALARSIVAVAGRAAAPAPAFSVGVGVGLGGGHGLGGVRVRVQLLLGYADRAPGPAPQRAPVGVLSSLLTALVTLPHVLGTGPLDILHQGVEHLALLIGLG